jgi:hypothetical protein
MLPAPGGEGGGGVFWVRAGALRVERTPWQFVEPEIHRRALLSRRGSICRQFAIVMTMIIVKYAEPVEIHPRFCDDSDTGWRKALLSRAREDQFAVVMT